MILKTKHAHIYILKMMAFHKTLISRVTQTCVVSPIGPRANFLFGRYQQESRANGTKGDADTLGGYLESLLGRRAFCKSEIGVFAIEPWSLNRVFSHDVTEAILVFRETMKWRPCWCPKPILWELNSFLMQTLSFGPINLHRC